jgi:hypothetical protein
MPPRIRRKAKPTMPRVHDRLSAELPTNAVVAMVQVDDPYEPGAQITVFRSVRDDPLARLQCRGHIDKAQYTAGRAWQEDYEAAEVGGVGAIDTTKEPVDGGRMREILTVKQQLAARRLARDTKALGQEGDILVRRVLVEGMLFEQIAATRGDTGQAMVKYLGRRFREALETLARVRGFVSQ